VEGELHPNKKMKKIIILIIALFLVALPISFGETRCIVPHGADVTYGTDVYQEMHNSSFVITDSGNNDKHEYKVKNREDACSPTYRTLPEKDTASIDSTFVLDGTYTADTLITGITNPTVVDIQVKGFKQADPVTGEVVSKPSYGSFLVVVMIICMVIFVKRRRDEDDECDEEEDEHYENY